MNAKTIIEKLTELENTIAELKAQLVAEAKPFKLAFVNFFAGGKSYAYTADKDYAEGDVVLVPTASRGNIAGVVVHVESYAQEDLPFRDTKTVIGKLEELDIAPAELIRMASELAPAIADKEASKARLLAFLARQTGQTAPSVPDNATDGNAEPDTVAVSSFGDDWDDDSDDGVIEGDGSTPEPAPGEPDTTVTVASSTTPF